MVAQGTGMAGALAGMGRLTELRQRLLFLVGALVVYRIGTFIPVPGVNPHVLAALFAQQQGTILDMFTWISLDGYDTDEGFQEYHSRRIRERNAAGEENTD